MKNQLRLPPIPIIDEKKRITAPGLSNGKQKSKAVYTADEMWNRQRQGRSATERFRSGNAPGYFS